MTFFVFSLWSQILSKNISIKNQNYSRDLSHCNAFKELMNIERINKWKKGTFTIKKKVSNSQNWWNANNFDRIGDEFLIFERYLKDKSYKNTIIKMLIES